jgi:hypothetical protein
VGWCSVLSRSAVAASRLGRAQQRGTGGRHILVLDVIETMLDINRASAAFRRGGRR